MKKIFLKVIVLVVMCSIVLSLCACSFPTTKPNPSTTTKPNMTDSEKDKDKDNVKPSEEQAMSLKEVFDNYKSESKKESDVTATIGIVLHADKGGTNTEYNIGLKGNMIRMSDEGKMYGNVSLKGNTVDDGVIGILALIGEYFKKNKFNSSSADVEKANEIAENMDHYIEYIADFLRGRILLDAQLGIEDNTMNVKAKYDRKSDKGANEIKDIWFGLKEETVKSASDLLGSRGIVNLLMDSVFSGLSKDSDLLEKDIAKDKFYKGKHNFDIVMDTSESALKLASSIVNIEKILCKDKTKEQLEFIQSTYERIKPWISVKKADVKVDIANKLPKLLTTESAIQLNVPTDEFSQLIADMRKKGIISGVAAIIVNTAVAKLGTCGINGEKNYIGIEFKITAEESFSYECNLSNKDKELFYPTDIKFDDRVMIEDLLNEKVEEKEEILKDLIEDLDLYLANLISGLPNGIPDEIKNSVSDSVKKALENFDLKELTGKKVKETLAGCLSEINTDSYGPVKKLAIDAAIKIAINKLTQAEE